MRYFVILIAVFLGWGVHAAEAKKKVLLSVPINQVETFFTRVENKEGVPLYYYTDIDRYPCNDSLCQRMQLRMYWDAWGNYLFFSFENGQELTKVDHVPFSDKDYKRLHKLLNNPKAFIQYYKMEDLTEKQSETYYYSVDAVTSATVADVNIVYECVKGAVKTCYTLWQIANNKALKQALLNETLSSVDWQEWDQPLLQELAMALKNYQLLPPGVKYRIIDRLKKKSEYHLLSAYKAYIHYIDFTPEPALINQQIQNLENNDYSALMSYNFLLFNNVRGKKMRNFHLHKFYNE